jgi:hypothetical protein
VHAFDAAVAAECVDGTLRLLRIAPKTLRLAAEAGEIEAIHPLPDLTMDLRSRRAHDISSPIDH